MTSDAKLFDLEIDDLVTSLKSISGNLPAKIQLQRLYAVKERIGRLWQVVESSLPKDIVSK